MIMKKYLFLAASALALASCSSDDIIGNNGGGQQSVDNVAINFNSGTNNITRATKTGKEAASALSNNFVVYGYKTTTGNPATSVVYDHYNVKYTEETAGQTTSNTKGWEYVGVEKNSLNELESSQQTIKYWDYSASQYDFIAFSFGSATQGTGENKVEASKVTTDGPKYTLTGSATELAKCFIADRVTAKPNATNEKDQKLYKYGSTIGFNFRSLATKVRMGIYETVPGYAIKNVVFYSGDNTPLSGDDNQPTLYAKDNTIASGAGKMTVTFGSNDESKTDYNQAKVEWEGTEENASYINLPKIAKASSKEGSEKLDPTNYITRTSTDARTDVEYKPVLSGTEVGELTLKVDYTLESIDGSGEEIKVTGATATVPAAYTNWQPNYAYTYIFKISDKTNGSTNPDGPDTPAGLYPITFDAVVTETEEGLQETITAVDASITTYALGAVNNEYKANSNIYVSVGDNTELYPTAISEHSQNIGLYTVETEGNYYAATEANVKLAMEKTADENGNHVLTNGINKLTVKPVTITLSKENKIAANDAVDGNEIAGNFAKFTPTDAGNYVVEYTATDGKKYYKVIKVVAE